MVMVVLMWMMMINIIRTLTPIGYLVRKKFTDDNNLLSGDEHDGNCTSVTRIAKEISCI